MFSPLVAQLIQALKCLNGVGEKTAQRMALNLLLHERQRGANLAAVLQQALVDVGRCQYCNLLSEVDVCNLCSNPKRSSDLLCVVENQADVFSIEQMNAFSGKYFVLDGTLSPLDGIGPNDIGIDKLIDLIESKAVTEVIFAVNATIEGETTTHYIASLLKHKTVKCSRLARGVPIGGELEYLDTHTIANAFSNRDIISTDTI